MGVFAVSGYLYRKGPIQRNDWTLFGFESLPRLALGEEKFDARVETSTSIRLRFSELRTDNCLGCALLEYFGVTPGMHCYCILSVCPARRR